MLSRFAPLLVVALALITARAATADELRLANGDRLTGTVVSLAGGTLVFSTPHGDLRIPWDTVTALAVAEPILAAVGAAPPALVTIAAAPEDGRATLQPGATLPLADITALFRPQPALTLGGRAGAGFVTSGGNTDVNSLRVDADLAIRHRDNRYTASAALNRAKDRDTETARNWTSAFNYDRFLTGDLFVNANAIVTSDRFRDLDLRTALGLGLGFQVLETTLAHLTANAGLGWVHENFDEGVSDSYTAVRESAALDIFVVPDRVQVFHQHDVYVGVTGERNLFVRTRAGVRLGLVGGLVATLQHDVDYDRSPAPGRRHADRTFALTFGYQF